MSSDGAHVSVVPFEAKIRFRDLDFDSVRVERLSARGVPFSAWEPRGVPRIPDKQLTNVVYLYRSREAAESGEDAGGTGFAVTIDSSEPGKGWCYIVTNYHVAVAGGFSVIRVNTYDGGHDILEFGPEDWEFDPVSGTDIAVVQLKIDLKACDLPMAAVQSFVTPDFMAEANIGPGDEVFMCGRFVDNDGGPTNRPAARFGHISIMPSPLLQTSGKYADAFCIDMNSRTGYSGSPVWVYRTPGRELSAWDFKTTQNYSSGGVFLMLLGIHYGQFPEFWKVIDGKIVVEPQTHGEPAMGTDAQIRGMSGMTCVLPAWRILELLDRPIFKKRRDEDEIRLAKGRQRNSPAAEA